MEEAESLRFACFISSCFSWASLLFLNLCPHRSSSFSLLFSLEVWHDNAWAFGNFLWHSTHSNIYIIRQQNIFTLNNYLIALSEQEIAE